ncbi:hypothetical protein BHE74_00025144 [Ensete ventricosum]|nr:hypothetical protein GW17_00039307 [Ensete ventricosum]RWW67421.1 hypothetical protein BHE74_00025144 [Ensete ventricosum]RZS02424.1 hypothetical protein BHM03_00032476 [Ensete ventricosum]
MPSTGAVGSHGSSPSIMKLVAVDHYKCVHGSSSLFCGSCWRRSEAQKRGRERSRQSPGWIGNGVAERARELRLHRQAGGASRALRR